MDSCETTNELLVLCFVAGFIHLHNFQSLPHYSKHFVTVYYLLSLPKSTTATTYHLGSGETYSTKSD